jgi:hypothetical protein
VDVTKRDTIRELVELEAELRRHGMHKGAKTVGNAVKLLRRVELPGLTQAFVTKATTSDDDDISTIP